MSTENETQIVVASPTLTTEAVASSEKKVTLTCKTCETLINHDDTKILCTKPKCGAATCNTCIDLMLKVMFSQPALNYPLSCGSCGHSYDTTTIDAILVKHELYEQFIACVLPLFWSEDCLEENEQLAQCMYSISQRSFI